MREYQIMGERENVQLFISIISIISFFISLGNFCKTKQKKKKLIFIIIIIKKHRQFEFSHTNSRFQKTDTLYRYVQAVQDHKTNLLFIYLVLFISTFSSLPFAGSKVKLVILNFFKTTLNFQSSQNKMLQIYYKRWFSYVILQIPVLIPTPHKFYHFTCI